MWTFFFDEDHDRRVDHGLTGLLVLQLLTLFAVVPFSYGLTGRIMLDICHIGYAFISVAVLTRHRALRALLIATIGMLIASPLFGTTVKTMLHLGANEQHEIVALVAFVFNGAVTMLVARHVFAPGRVTAHRVRGAVLLYLNVAALFALAYIAIEMHIPGAFVSGTPAQGPGTGGAIFTYFSLTTVTTTGYGDIVPNIPLTRSLANLEAVFGQLFPATLLARIVALHLSHEASAGPMPRSDVGGRTVNDRDGCERLDERPSFDPPGKS